MANGILYFSGTGNSLYIAQKIKEALGGNIIFIPNYKGNGSEFDKLIIVTPVYSFGMPKHVYEFIPKIDKNIEVYIVQNFGGTAFGADYLMCEYCRNNDINIRGIYLMQMPENFTTTFTVPKFYIAKALKNADKRIGKIIEDIKNACYNLPHKKLTQEAMFLKNLNNWHKLPRDFSVNETCVKCGKCVSICPVKNISIIDGKVTFADSCVACLACYHRCTEKAIVYKNHNKKDRYVNPNVNEADIGKDFID